jgi:hypothetical protein
MRKLTILMMWPPAGGGPRCRSQARRLQCRGLQGSLILIAPPVCWWRVLTDLKTDPTLTNFTRAEASRLILVTHDQWRCHFVRPSNGLGQSRPVGLPWP